MKDKSQVIKTDNEVSRKKIYHAPVLKVYGNIAVITKAGTEGEDDNINDGKTGGAISPDN